MSDFKAELKAIIDRREYARLCMERAADNFEEYSKHREHWLNHNRELELMLSHVQIRN